MGDAVADFPLKTKLKTPLEARAEGDKLSTAIRRQMAGKL